MQNAKVGISGMKERRCLELSTALLEEQDTTHDVKRLTVYYGRVGIPIALYRLAYNAGLSNSSGIVIWLTELRQQAEVFHGSSLVSIV